MEKEVFTTSEIARISNHSRDSVKRWLEKGKIKGYRVGNSGHWRVLSKDLALFLEENDIPFPDPEEWKVDLKALADSQIRPTFCWEFYRDKTSNHLRAGTSCEDCLVHKVKSIHCYALRDEVGHRKIYCGHSCMDCAYFHLQRKELLSKEMQPR